MNIRSINSFGNVKFLLLSFIFVISSACQRDDGVLSTSGDAVEKPKAVVHISSNPDEAEVKVDGVVVGKTPCFVEEITYGRHNFKLTRENYVSRIEEVIISEPSVFLHFPLIKYMGSIQVNTIDPQNADIYINDALFGQTPIPPTVIQTGTHKISVKCPAEYGDYYDITDTITIDRKEEAYFSFNMTSIPVISESGAASLIESGTISGKSNTFTDISKVYCYVDLENSNSDNWKIRDMWYRNNDPIRSGDWSETHNQGTIELYQTYIEDINKLVSGSYRLDIFIKENDYEYLLTSISFTVE